MMLLLALLLGSAPDPAALAGIGITGRTAAPDSATAQAALNEARGFAARPPMNCGEVGGAKASLMPKSWVPADPNFRIGPKGARYERWEIQACGKAEPFLVVFWKDRKAGPQVQVGHPFPVDPVKP
jgi:hypothetical protein